jgi:hypothetical protein
MAQPREREIDSIYPLTDEEIDKPMTHAGSAR